MKAKYYIYINIKGNGLLRLGDIIRYPNVSAAAGSKSDVLSFQRGYLSLLAVNNYAKYLKDVTDDIAMTVFFF